MIGIIGIAYKTAPLKIRELFSMSENEAGHFIKQIRHDYPCLEIVVLSTCNRLEIIFYLNKRSQASVNRRILSALARFKNIPWLIDEFFYQYFDEKAVEHLFEVSAGLDSMVLGENQILSQIKAAFKNAVDHKSTGPILNKLFHRSFEVGKKVRTLTDINKGSSSIGFAAVEVIYQIQEEISDKKILLIGAGKTAELILKALYQKGNRRITISNRNLQKAKALATRYDADILKIQKLYQALSEFDIILVATSSKKNILNEKDFRFHSLASEKKSFLLIDLSVPRNINSKLGDFEFIQLYNIDDLIARVNQTFKSRENEIEKARKIIEEIKTDYISWKKSLNLSPVINELKYRFELMLISELNALEKVLPLQEYDTVFRISRKLTNKYMGTIVKNLKQITNNGDDLRPLELVNELFDLDDLELNGAIVEETK